MPSFETTTDLHSEVTFQDILASAFYPSDDLNALSPNKVTSAEDVADFVKDQSNQVLEGELSEAELWSLCEQFLDTLQTAEEEKEIWGSKHARETVAQTLEASLERTEVTPENAAAFLNTVKLLAKNSTIYTRVPGSAMVRNHYTLMNNTDPDTKSLYRSMLGDLDIITKISNGYKDSDGKLDGDLIDEGREFYLEIIKALNMNNPEGCVKAWGLEPTINIHRIHEIEKEYPGAGALLHNFYGIRNFNRWPIDLLKDQFENHGKTDKPYGLSIAADDNSLVLWRELGIRHDVKPDYYFRAIEVDSSSELTRRMIALDKLYGEEQKVSFAIIHAHGDSESIVLAKPETNLGRLSLDNHFTGVSRWFVENPLLVLASCSTGQEQGIAQKLSRQAHATVVAPREDAAVKDLEVIKDDDKNLRIIPSFAHQEGAALSPDNKITTVQAMLYIDGEQISTDDARYTDYFKVDPASSK